jgi:hypothetical protein
MGELVVATGAEADHRPTITHKVGWPTSPGVPQDRRREGLSVLHLKALKTLGDSMIAIRHTRR